MCLLLIQRWSCSSVLNVNLCVCLFFCSVFKDLYIDLFCILFSCSSVFVCSRASVPLSLFCLSALVSCSKIGILIYIFVFWIRSIVFKFLFYSSSVLFLYSKICISICVLFIRILYSFQVRVQVLFFCSNLFRSWFSVSFFLLWDWYVNLYLRVLNSFCRVQVLVLFKFCITNESDDGFKDEIESYVTVTQSRSCGSKVLDSI